MFEFLPSWVGDAMILLAFIMGPSGFIWSYLQRKGANRSLVVEEGGLEVEKGKLEISQFDSLTAKYEQLLERAETAATTATEEAKAVRKEAAETNTEFQTQINDLGNDVRDLRGLFTEVIRQHGIQLTPEQQRRFEATKPKPRRGPRTAHA